MGVDYSFTPHPDLLSTHRVSVQFTPAFPKFNGRNFRRQIPNISVQTTAKPVMQKPLVEPIQPTPTNPQPLPTEVKPQPAGNEEILEEEEEEP